MATGITNADTIKKYGGDYNIIPTTSEIIIPQRTYFKQDLTLLGDDNLLPQNIKNNIVIAGVMGRAQEVKDFTPECGVFYDGNGERWLQPYGLSPRDETNKVFRISNRLVCPLTLDTILYSEDNGRTWNSQSTHSGASWNNYYKIKVVETENPSLLVGVANSDIIIKSENGLDWTKCNYTGGQIKDISCGTISGGNCWIVLTHDYKVYYSFDGTSFTLATILDSTNSKSYNNIIYFNKAFIIENSYFATSCRYTSTDGITWNASYPSVSYDEKFLPYIVGDPVYIGVSKEIICGLGYVSTLSGYTVKTSTDTINWTDTGLSTIIEENEGYDATLEFLSSFDMNDGSTILVAGSSKLPFMYYSTVTDTAGSLSSWNIVKRVNELNGIFLQNLSNTNSTSNYLLIGYGGIYYNDNVDNTINNLLNGTYKRALLDSTYYNKTQFYSYGYTLST